MDFLAQEGLVGREVGIVGWMDGWVGGDCGYAHHSTCRERLGGSVSGYCIGMEVVGLAWARGMMCLLYANEMCGMDHGVFI